MQRVFEWAVATEHRADNPVRAAGSVLPKGNGRAKHFKALPHAKVAGALATIRDSAAAPVTKLAIEFLALTATRSGEVRLAAWDEIDLSAALWTVPAERTKTGKEFRVPLSPAALSVLRAAEAYRDGDMVFPSPRGRALSDATLSKLFRSLDIPAVPHGFRSSFRDWAGEVAKTPREVAEACLAHVVQSKVEAAYARSDLLERRRELMDAWAAYVEGGKPMTEDRIVRIHDVTRLTGLSKATVYRLSREGKDHFPPSIRLGQNSIGWRLSAVEAWLRYREVSSETERSL